MTGERIHQALGRIQAAVARIEAAGNRPRSDDDALAARHDALREAVRQSLSEMDALIGKGPA